ncbi:MAG: hypothetical protein ACJ78Q_18605, partial [Chloroflexia bacterium]
LTVRNVNGSYSYQITGRSGSTTAYPSCNSGLSFVDFDLELHDECGQTISAECSTNVYSDPCP